MLEKIRRGSVSCPCGNTFSYETVFDTLECLNCGRENAVDGEVVDSFTVDSEPSSIEEQESFLEDVQE